MINLKLKTIASFILPDDIVLDTCSDHAYLAIYLKKEQLCKEVYASDINQKALDGAKKNILAAHLNIKTFLSDGFKNIPIKYINTAVIAGVGTNTVLDIMAEAPFNINKYIISSNNQLDVLRKSLYRMGYYIKQEVVVFEHHKYYSIMLVTKDYQKENRLSLKYGRSNNLDYLNFLSKKEQEILAKIPATKVIKRWKHKQNIRELQKLIKRI